jgi:sugar phosphate isomerase/epimerase
MEPAKVPQFYPEDGAGSHLPVLYDRGLHDRQTSFVEPFALTKETTVSQPVSAGPPATLPPFSLGVCSWSLQVKSIPELARLLEQLAINVVQIACGDPHHASWDEGDDLPAAAKSSGIVMTSAMLGFLGEDYTSPQTIKQTGGFGDPELRSERLSRLQWGVDRTVALGLSSLTLHAGFLPDPDDPGRDAFLATLAKAAQIAADRHVSLAFETGQETAERLRATLDELNSPYLKVNFDPANMLLYDMGDPIRAIEVLGPDIQSVHVKDARRPKFAGQWGEEVPLGQGEVNLREFIRALERNGFTGPLIIEREVGNQATRLRDVAAGLTFLREILAP